ncbi:MAG: N-6 DNA methylase [Lachnospiraceae bacterium]|nr:N-6 DNA methylase [Lachnospiraceae bacterium]
MDTLAILENSFVMINKNLSYYKRYYAHQYYIDIDDSETSFIDRHFKSISLKMAPQDKMLNYSVSTICTATAILAEIMKRFNIKYSDIDLEKICKGYTALEYKNFDLSSKSFEDLKEDLFALLTDGIDLDSRKKSGSERTPNDIINYMLDLIGYHGKQILGKTITDPACGTGTFVAQIVDRLVDAVPEEERQNISHRMIDEGCIKAYDTKPSNVFVTKVIITAILVNRGCLSDIDDVAKLINDLPVYCRDYLTVHEKTDYVIGNPPYIRLQNLSNENREYIKKNFDSATGRFDIYTCFLENGNKNLSSGGKLCLITSNKYLTANYGVGIRDYLSGTGCVRKIVDLFDTKFFGAAVLPAITVCVNEDDMDSQVEYIGVKTTDKNAETSCDNTSELFEFIENRMTSNKAYIRFGEYGDKVLEISRSLVSIPKGGKTWNFSSVDENDIKHFMETKAMCRLSDLMEICVGIKTTADTVFVKPMTSDFVEEKSFEEDVIFPLIQSFDVERWRITWGKSKKDRYILYPHRESAGNMEAIPLSEIPNAAIYLEQCADILKKRTYLMESKTRSWYECWVPQKLSKFRQAKIVTRDIVSHNSFAYDGDGRLCQGNTFFLIRRPESIFNMIFSSLDEEDYYYFLLGLLNSHAMEYYQKMISGCLYSQKYRYTSTNLNRWPIPEFDTMSAKIIADKVRMLIENKQDTATIEDEINTIVNGKFGFTESDVNQIEEFIKVAV